MVELKESAYAKVNLTLDVLGQRGDGYHDLRSVMQTVSLSDELTVRLETGRWCVVCDDEAVPTGESNLIIRAAREYCAAANIAPNGVEVELQKRIPMQAGLGGGSADAAAVLRALNRYYGALTHEQLLAAAANVGSDVPFCLDGGTMLCEGRGEIMTRINPLPDCWFVLCKPEFSIATPDLFRELDIHAELQADGVKEAETAILAGELPQGVRTNRFELLLEQQYPLITQLRRTLLEQGALLASLSGTGSAYYGLFASKERAEAAGEALKALVPQVFLAQPV